MAERTSHPGEIVLIHYQEKPTVYARIEAIEADVKKEWYQVTLLLLSIPARTVTWILREAYINGDPFTMGGQSMRLEKVKHSLLHSKPEQEKGRDPKQKESDKPGKVIPFKREP